LIIVNDFYGNKNNTLIPRAMKFPFKAVLFDWAYTLTDFVDEDNSKGFEKLSDFMENLEVEIGNFRSDYPKPLKLFSEMISKSRECHLEACFDKALNYLLFYFNIKIRGKTTLDELLTIYYKELIKPRKVYPDVTPTLIALQNWDIKMGIISNTTTPVFLKHFERKSLGLDSYFDFSIYSSEFPFRKPHPSIFKLALERLDLPPEEILFVGDNLTADVGGSLGVGMRSAWLNRDGLVNDKGIQPDYEIQSLEEILALENPVRTL
jgi:putative hydrolase of the HAD superfamily